MAEELVKQEDENMPSRIYRVCLNCGVVTTPDKWNADKLSFNGREFDGETCPGCGSFHMHDITEFNDFVAEAEDVPAVYTMRFITPVFTVDEVIELDKIKKAMADYKKQDEAKSPKIKNFLLENGIREFDFEGQRMFITFQNRGKMDEDRLVEVIRECCTEAQIKAYDLMKEIVKPDALERAIADGLVSMKDLAPCMVPNMVPLFSLNPKPKKGSKKGPESGFGGNF